MRGLLTTVAVVAVLGSVAPVARAQPKDTPLAAFTRVKKLKGKVTVDFKNEFLKETFAEISDQLEREKLGVLKVDYDKGVSGNTRVSYSGKDVTVEEALDGILKQLDLGYVVISNATSRQDGYLKIVKGPNRGYEDGQEPKTAATGAKPDPKKPDPKKPDDTAKKPEEPKKPEPKAEEAKKPDDAPKATPEEEKLAAAKLELAKELIEKNEMVKAKAQLKFLLKKYPGAAAATEAKELLEKADKDKDK